MANSKGIAYVGLILGLIGAGLGSYVFFDYQIAPMLGLGDPVEEVSDIDSWFASRYNTGPLSTGVYEQLPNLMISFDTTKTAILYILYTGYVKFDTALGTYAYLQIRLNDTVVVNNHYYVAAFGAAPVERYDVTMQSYIPNLLPGSYNITVWVDVDHLTTEFLLNTLYAQTHN